MDLADCLAAKSSAAPQSSPERVSHVVLFWLVAGGEVSRTAIRSATLVSASQAAQGVGCLLAVEARSGCHFCAMWMPLEELLEYEQRLLILEPCVSIVPRLSRSPLGQVLLRDH